MNILKEWFNDNGIILNTDNTAINYQSKKGINTGPELKENVFLGYTIDNITSHSAHITKLCEQLASANYTFLDTLNTDQKYA